MHMTSSSFIHLLAEKAAIVWISFAVNIGVDLKFIYIRYVC